MTKRIIILAAIVVMFIALFFYIKGIEPHRPVYEFEPRLADDIVGDKEPRDEVFEWFLGGEVKGSVKEEDGSNPVRTYYEDGSVKEEAYFSGGAPHGPAKWYYESGTLEQEVNFDLGKRHGVMRTYYENGSIKEEVFYEEGLLEGTAKWFYESGVLMQEAEYAAGKREGITRVYNEDGTLKSEWEYKDDIPVKKPEVYRIGIVE
jgi:antitoxin component YwqK of YwqJK toxin-antitoxin module